MAIGDTKTTIESSTRNRQLTGVCPLILQCNTSEEYQLPTQRHKRKQSKTIPYGNRNFRPDRGGIVKASASRESLELTDKILKLYSTPVEREIPLKRALSVERKGRKIEENCASVDDRCYLEKASVLNPSASALQFSSNVVNDYIKNGEKNRLEQCSLSSRSSCSLDDNVMMEHKKCQESQIMSKIKTLERLHPCHSRLVKEFIFRPGEALKINGLVLSERRKVGFSSDNHMKSSANIQSTSAPKHWWDYLNKKIAKKNTNAKPPKSVSSNKMCKVCHLDHENRDFVKQSKLGKDVLHIDLKRLTEIRSKNWSSYGHYTRIHKLRYTNRKNDLAKDEGHGVDVDEDYLSVDVDRLMKVYERNQNSCPDLLSSAVSPCNKTDKDPDSRWRFPSMKSNTADLYKTASGKVSSPISNVTFGNNYPGLQRPPTTTLRSCLNFTSRKTLFYPSCMFHSNS